MSRVFAAAVAFVAWATVGSLAVPAPAAASGASAVIEETANQVLAVLNDKALTSEQRRGQIEEIAYARFDMLTTSKLVLARNWKRFSPAQQEEYIEEFKRYLANQYGSRIDRYDQEKVKLTGERAEPRGDVTVHTVIVGGEYEGAIVDYRMREKDGTWKIIDVVVEGVSLVSNYRDQFKEVLSQGGPARLLEQLKAKNASGVIDELPGVDTATAGQ